VLLLSLLTGCGGGATGSELTVRPRPLALSDARRTIRLPADEKFSLTQSPSQRAPALGGEASADASASPDGRGEASAKVSGGGTASAAFQVGHSLSNSTDRQADFKVRVKFNYECTASCTPPGGPDATVSLSVFARDDRGRLLQTVGVLSHTTEAGAAGDKGGKESEFTATIGAGGSLTIYASGGVTLDVPDQHSADATVKLSGLEMEITSTPAAAVPTTQKVGSTTQSVGS